MIVIDKILGLVLILFGVWWFLYHIKNPFKPKGSMNWTMNFKSIAGSLMTILLGLLFILGIASLSMWF